MNNLVVVFGALALISAIVWLVLKISLRNKDEMVISLNSTPQPTRPDLVPLVRLRKLCGASAICLIPLTGAVAMVTQFLRQ